MNLSLSVYQIRLLRLKSQRLTLPKTGERLEPARVLEDVLGVQAQDWTAALLSIRARSSGVTAARVEQTLEDERSIVRTWCIRGTLHLVTAQDARWLIPLLGPALIEGDKRRMKQLGWDEASAATGKNLVQQALAAQGELTRSEIKQLLQKHNLPSDGQAPVHLLYRAALEGILSMGLERGKESTYRPLEAWVGKLEPLPREQSLAKIANRYLEAYGPARPEDLASWSGLKLSEARRAWELIAADIIQLTLPINDQARRSAWLLKTRLPWLDDLPEKPGISSPVVRLLPRFDTYLLGYASRELAVDPAYARKIHPGGGIIHPVLLVDGKALGGWKISRRKNYLEVKVEPFEDLAEELHSLIEEEIADLGRFYGEEISWIVKDHH